MSTFQTRHQRVKVYRHGTRATKSFDRPSPGIITTAETQKCPNCFREVGLLPDGRFRKHYHSRLIPCLTRWPDGRIEWITEE